MWKTRTNHLKQFDSWGDFQCLRVILVAKWRPGESQESLQNRDVTGVGRQMYR